MRLTLVKQGHFLGTICDYYIDEESNIYMSRTQIGYALQYKNPQHAVLMIHQRHHERLDKFSIEVKGCQFVTPSKTNKDKNAQTFMYVEKGIYEVCRHSKQKVADDFYDWFYETISSIKHNGYYIAAEKDESWLGVRADSKQTHHEFTDEIQAFVEYALQQGSRKPEWYYKTFTELVNKKLDIPKGMKRDELPQPVLMDIMALERVIAMKLPKLVTKEMQYKQVYQEIKKLIEAI